MGKLPNELAKDDHCFIQREKAAQSNLLRDKKINIKYLSQTNNKSMFYGLFVTEAHQNNMYVVSYLQIFVTSFPPQETSSTFSKVTSCRQLYQKLTRTAT